ncbi:hypothetical protein LZZ90_11395 [Flavobacterium sp. SM15]|uniref:hypothetical protein n=1 Tax=Flavobacterium sp. SM15 TaxID=2908005 RepID=UPI001EDC3CC1|nr:hypothetical protein [Flavobacterium sp. SM15]MCG2612112.1 hypothetical protein [Flavobacterium sp. SM15]
MKFLVNIVLFLFITFLATPTIVSFIESDTDTSIVYSFSEEEVHKEIKEIPAKLENILQVPTLVLTSKTSVINFENLQKHDNVFEEIFSPPPELI